MSTPLSYQTGHELALLETGQAYFPALIRAIDLAETEILLETYIFWRDDVTHAVVNALNHASARGVAVKVVVDGYGSLKHLSWLRQALQGPVLQVFRPESGLWSLNTRRLRRLHRKLSVFDGQTALIGGINLLDDFLDPNHGALEHPRYDFAVAIQGPVVAQIQASMRTLWWRLAVINAPLAKSTRATVWDNWVRKLAAPTPSDAIPVPNWPHTFVGIAAALAVRDNFRHRRAIESEYLRQIRAANQRIIIANAYFLPGHKLRRALIHAARRGVQVRLLLQGKVEYKFQHFATQSLYDELLGARIEIFEYQRSFLHAKVAVIDHWATVGSSNIDPFSLLLAREANIFVQNQAVADALAERLNTACRADAHAVDAPSLQNASLGHRLAKRLALWTMRLALALSIGGQRY